MLNPEADRAPSIRKSRDKSQDKSRGSLSASSVNDLPVIVPAPRVSNHRLKHLASTLSHRAKAARAQEELGTRPSLRDSQHLASRKSLEHAISQERIRTGGVEHDLGPLTAAAERTRRRIMILKAREERWVMDHGDSLFSDNGWAFGTRSTMRSDSLQYGSRGTIASSSLRLSPNSSNCEADIPLLSHDRTRQSCQEGVGDDVVAGEDEDENEDGAEEDDGEPGQEEDWASASLWTATRPVTVSTPLTWRVRSYDQSHLISTMQKCPREALDRGENRSPCRRKTHPATLAREAVVSGDGGSSGRRNRGQLSMRAHIRATAEQAGPSLPSLIQNLAVLNGVRLFASEDVFNGLQVREIEREKASILSEPDSTWKVKRDIDMDCLMAHAVALGGRRELDKQCTQRQSDPGEVCKNSDIYFLARNWRIGKDDEDLPPIESVQSWPAQSEMKA